VPNVPLPPPITSFESLPRGILLVEEYNALAVAISSALRKFAPLHRVEVAHSFAEAETLAAQMRPELFVIDVDPPPFGEGTPAWVKALAVALAVGLIAVIAAGVFAAVF